VGLEADHQLESRCCLLSAAGRIVGAACHAGGRPAAPITEADAAAGHTLYVAHGHLLCPQVRGSVGWPRASMHSPDIQMERLSDERQSLPNKRQGPSMEKPEVRGYRTGRAFKFRAELAP
jgi:hypothetical protein